MPSGRSTHSSVRGAPPGATTQANHWPSGDQLSARTGSSPTGSATGAPASTSQTQTPGVPARSERNATRRPSGDGAGAKSSLMDTGGDTGRWLAGRGRRVVRGGSIRTLI
ncbi:hypothetical protein ONO86_02505 [Micromonospora noduli]|nr:hypothetical protein ONO86_02505 [Micromonospora noduli]